MMNETPLSLLLSQGHAHMRHENWGKAVRLFTDAIQREPHSTATINARARCYLKLGDYRATVEDAERLLELDVQSSDGLYCKAEGLFALGQFEFALVYFHRGQRLRESSEAFRLGVQKAKAAIEASFESVQQAAIAAGVLPAHMAVPIRGGGRRVKRPEVPIGVLEGEEEENGRVVVEARRPVKRTSEQSLLGPLYKDKLFLEELMRNPILGENGEDLLAGPCGTALEYIEQRLEFWRNRKPFEVEPVARVVQKRITGPVEEQAPKVRPQSAAEVQRPQRAKAPARPPKEPQSANVTPMPRKAKTGGSTRRRRPQSAKAVRRRRGDSVWRGGDVHVAPSTASSMWATSTVTNASPLVGMSKGRAGYSPSPRVRRTVVNTSQARKPDTDLESRVAEMEARGGVLDEREWSELYDECEGSLLLRGRLERVRGMCQAAANSFTEHLKQVTPQNNAGSFQEALKYTSLAQGELGECFETVHQRKVFLKRKRLEVARRKKRTKKKGGKGKKTIKLSETERLEMAGAHADLAEAYVRLDKHRSAGAHADTVSELLGGVVHRREAHELLVRADVARARSLERVGDRKRARKLLDAALQQARAQKLDDLVASIENLRRSL